VKTFLKLVGFVCFMALCCFIWQKADGWTCFGLITALVVGNLFEYLEGFIVGKEDEA